VPDAALLGQARDALAADGDPEGAARAERVLAGLDWDAGRWREGLEHLYAARRFVSRGAPASLQAEVLLSLASVLPLFGQRDQAVAYGREALALAREAGDAELLLRAHVNLGLARLQAGDRDGAADVEAGLAALANAAVALIHAGRLARAAAVQARCLELARRFGDAAEERWYRALQADGLYYAGRLSEAVALADELLAPTVDRVPSLTDSGTHLVRGRVRLLRHDAASRRWRFAPVS
jgi:tetratricopeptide (TPR) repeat protein